MIALKPTSIKALLTGRVIPFGSNGEPSAIDKQNLDHPVELTYMGFVGDEHGDLIHHGGRDKALHYYPAEHYAFWWGELPTAFAERWKAGGFGENLSATGLTENDVCIGDIFRLGSALIQVSQARQPCWKLNLRFGCPDMAKRVQSTARTGWYYRVLQVGTVAPGAQLSLFDRPCPDWPLSRLLHYFYRDTLNTEALREITSLGEMSPSWRKLAEQRLQTHQVENWTRRLDTPLPPQKPRTLHEAI